MITKQIRISEKAYKELESRKDKTGVNIRRQVDDLVLGKIKFNTTVKDVLDSVKSPSWEVK